MRSRFAIVLGVVAVLSTFAGPVVATSGIEPSRALTLSVDDPVNDHNGPVDVLGMVMDIDPSTGRYVILLRASSADPFVGAFRVNINLYNPDDGSFFQDTFNDYDLSSPRTDLELSGTSGVLTGWEPGDRVFTNSLSGTPNPPGTSLYRSTVGGFPVEFLTNEDVIAASDRSEPAVVEVLSPQLRTARLIDAVEALVTPGGLTADQAAGLVDKLTAVISSLNAGGDKSAMNQLGAFTNQVNAFTPNKLTESMARPLLDEAETIQTLIDH